MDNHRTNKSPEKEPFRVGPCPPARESVRRFANVLVLSAACLSAVRGAAHGDLHDRIAAITQQIASHPARAELYLKRGELRRLHAEWESALKDFDQAAALKPSLETVELARGKTLFDAGKMEPATEALSRFLSKYPDHVDALITRARAQARLQQRVAAVADYTRALSQPVTPLPEFYAERAALQAADGQLEIAVRGLDEGIRQIGPTPSLQLSAIDLLVRQRRYDNALERIDQLAARSPRKETWLARRGEILETAGRRADATRAFNDALAALNILPPSRRHTKAMEDLELRLKEGVERLSAPPQPVEIVTPQRSQTEPEDTNL